MLHIEKKKPWLEEKTAQNAKETLGEKQVASKGELLLMEHFKDHKLTPEREFRFHDTRRWRFDFAFPDRKLAVEVEGGTYTNGRHTRGSGYEKDLEKYNEAVKLGWKVLRFSTGMVSKGEAIKQVLEVIKG